MTRFFLISSAILVVALIPYALFPVEAKCSVDEFGNLIRPCGPPGSDTWLDPILQPFGTSDVVLVGKVIDVKELVAENQSEYSIAVEKYLKNAKPYDLIVAIGNGIAKKEITNYNEVDYFNEPIFEKGNRVFLYLNNKDEHYIISPYSFSITKNRSGGPPDYVSFNFYKNHYYGNEPITISGRIEKGYLYSSTAEHGANSTVSLQIYNPNHELYLSKIVYVEPDGVFSYKFKIKGELGIPGSYEYDLIVGQSLTGSTFEYNISPLQQFKSGIVAEDVKCKESMQLVIKSKDNSPACVKPASVEKLVAWGWAKPLES